MPIQPTPHSSIMDGMLNNLRTAESHARQVEIRLQQQSRQMELTVAQQQQPDTDSDTNSDDDDEDKRTHINSERSEHTADSWTKK